MLHSCIGDNQMRDTSKKHLIQYNLLSVPIYEVDSSTYILFV